jgi:hypothetical protein
LELSENVGVSLRQKSHDSGVIHQFSEVGDGKHQVESVSPAALLDHLEVAAQHVEFLSIRAISFGLISLASGTP